MSNVNRNRRRPSGWNRIGRGVALLMTLAACGRSSGCSGCSAEGPPFPEKDKIHSAVQVRLTDNGVGFLEDNLEPLLAQALPDGLNICLPGQGGDVLGLVQYGFCQDMCDDGGQGCQISIGIGGVDLELTQPATVRATITFSELSADIGIYANPIVDCGISIRGPGFPVSVDLNLSTPDPTRDLTFEIGGANYQLSQLDIQLHGNDGFLSPLCDLISGVINLPFLGDLLLDTLQGLVDGLLMDQINGFVEDFTCRTCETVQDCPSEGGATCEGGRCMLDGACLAAPLGVHGLLDVGAMLSSFSPGLKAELQYLITPGSYVEVENEGLSLGVIGGARADKSRCVPNRPQPPTDVEPPRAQSLRTNVDPAGRPYEVGIGISDLFIEHAMWAVFNSGTLCLGITSDAVAQLNVQTIGLLLRDLSRLTHGSQSLAITLSPQEVPVATFGGNVVVPDPENEGQYLLQDPLMTLQIPDLWLDFHAFVEGRWVRVFSLNADVEVPLGIAFDPGNGIIPVLGDLSQAIRNVEVANGEVMRDDPQALANLLPVLLGPLLPQLAGGLSDPIALPDIMGYSLDLQEHSIQGIENNTFLGIFANLERAPVDPNAMNQIRFQVDTSAEILETHIPTTAEFQATSPDFWKRPSVRLAVDAFDGTADEAPMEAQWRVDQGTWSLFTPAREMVVRSPLFALQGRHQVEVRARRMDDYHTLDLTPAEVEVIIDSVAPDLTLTPVGSQITLAVQDMISPREGLSVAWRLSDEPEWTEVEPGETVIPGPTDEADLIVRAIDEAGNVTEQRIESTSRPLIGRASHDERTGAVEGGGGCGNCGGCVVPGRGASPGPLALFALLPLGAALRLRRRGQSSRLTAALLLVIAALLGACDDSASSKKNTGGADADTVLPTGDAGVRDGTLPPPPVSECEMDSDCPDGRVCREVAGENKCIFLSCADDPTTCEAVPCEGGRAAVCTAAGSCECSQPCPEGCPEGQYCCRANYACEVLPVACKDMVCDPGFEAMVLSEGMVDEDTCMTENVECTCVERHPIDLGSIGRYSDFVVREGAAVFSAYAETYGDLVVGRFDEAAQSFTWWWVDGVPADGMIEGGPSGPRGGITDRGPNVGTDTAIAVGPNGNLHIAYRDVDNQALKYALGVPDGDAYRFTTITLDADGDAGRWASISVDARGVPGIAYRVARRHEGEQWVSQVRYRLAKNDAPAGAADWLPAFVVTNSVLDAPCGGLCGRDEVCVAATQTCAAEENGCGACAEGEACVAGACAAVLEVPRLSDTYPEGTGLFTAQIRDNAGNPVVAWYDRTFGQLWWAKWADAGFGAPEQLAGYGMEGRDGDMGSNVDVTIDDRGNAHFCFQDGNTDSLRYLAPELGLDEWVDDGTREDDGRDWALHVVGEDCNIRLDAGGNPLIVYQDATVQDVVLARRTPEGAWVRTVIRGDEFEYRGAFGFYTRARVEGARLWISNFWWNNQDPAHPEGIEVLFQDL
jgi:hypothetical protein